MYEKIPNVRQSEAWKVYMESLIWKCPRISSGTIVNLFKTPLNFFNFGKIQKPFNLSASDLKEIDDICIENRVKFMKLEPNSNQSVDEIYENGFIDSNMPLSPSVTAYTDLTKSTDELWGALSRSGKYGVNRAKRENTRVESFVNPKDGILNDFYKTHRQTSKRNKFMSRGFDDLQKRRDAFGDESYLLMVYDGEGNLSGGKFFLGNGEMTLFACGGTTDVGRKNRSGFALTWESIVYFKERGYKIMDLEGMYDPRFPKDYKGWEGFTEFKRKFSPVEVVFHKPFIKYYNPVFRFISRFVDIPF